MTFYENVHRRNSAVIIIIVNHEPIMFVHVF